MSREGGLEFVLSRGQGWRNLGFFLKGVIAKNERGYRLNAIEVD